MTRHIHSPLVREMFESGIVDIYKGELLVWDMPAVILPMNNVLLSNVLKDKYPEMRAQDLEYQMGKMQSHRGNKVLMQRYGYKHNEQLMKDTFGKSELLGLGVFAFLDFDPDNKCFVVINYLNPYAHHYLKVLGRCDSPVCHFLRGLCAGSFQAFFEEEEMFAAELHCIAKGDKACVFKIKPFSQWDASSGIIKSQFVQHKLPNEIFSKEYSWDNLISRHSGQPRDDSTKSEIKEKFSLLIEQYRKEKILQQY